MSEQLSTAGPYQIVDVLQRGARSVIYIALRPDSGEEVVLKMAKDPWRSGGDSAANAANRLLHRHIVRVIDQGEHNGFPYLVMERLQGRTLQEMMTDPSFAADLPTRIDLIAQLCIGLHHAHEHQIVHGNVTPDNIFVTNDGVTKILNIGATSAVDHTVVSDNALAGSFEYMSPEQIIGRDTLDGRSDIFSAGVILYELVSGKRPFQAGTTTATLARVLRDDPLPLDAPDRLNTIVRRALEKEPAKRFASAQEFAYALWMMDIPDATLEQEPDVDVSASVTMFADAKYEEAENAASTPVPAAAAFGMSKQMAIYAAVALGVLIVAAAAFVSC